LIKLTKDYIGSDREQLVNLKTWENAYPAYLTIVTHPIFRFCLLDRLLDAYQFRKSNKLQLVERQKLPDLAGKFGDRVSFLILFI
jgi:hypothetical protein